ncbi:MAG: hypothetical protein LBF84_01920 [Holosporales bacterium]|nr:hypothetical protein [Holosporales bacterium]
MCLFLGQSCSPQIYVGVNFQKNLTTNTINLGEEAYWNCKIKEFYSDALAEIYNQYAQNPTGDKKWFLIGLPSDFFNVLLQCAPSNLYDKTNDDHQVSIVIGSYFFRHEAFLAAAEISLGVSSFKVEQKVQIHLFDGDAPQEMRTTPAQDGTITLHEKFSILKTLTQSLFFGGNILLNQYILLKNNFSADVHFRVGRIVKDRLYVFSILGATINKSHVEVIDDNIETDGLTLYYCTNQWASDTSALWKPETLAPKDDLNTQKLAFIGEKTSVGVVAGIGVEFFVSHKITIRTQCAYAYYPSYTILSTNGFANIRHWAKGIKVNFSLLWRF